MLIAEIATLNTLKRNTDRFGPVRRDGSKRVQVSDMKFIPAPNDSSLIIRCDTSGSLSNYNTDVQFTAVDYADLSSEAAPPGYVEIEAVDGTVYYIRTVDWKSGCKVRCTCPDFRFMFSTWTEATDSLFGNQFPFYKKKTNRPPKNPSKTPGACKHILAVFDRLKKDRISY